MLTLNRSNSYFFINGEISPDIVESLDRVLSYYVQNYEKTDAFQSGKWDGKERLFRRAKNGSYYFPFGLIDNVIQVLSIWDIPFEVKEPRENARIEEMNDPDGFSLREYQREAIYKLVNNCYNSSGVIALPTAAGKTRCALWWAKKLNLPFIVVVHRKELMYQWRDAILDAGFTDYGLIGDGINDTFKHFVTIGMVQILNNMDLKGVETGLLIIDECHTIPSKTAYSVCMKIKADYRLGLSATPTRSDGAEMKIFACCGTIAASISVEQLVEGGYLAAPIFRMENLSPVRLKYNESWQQVYKQGIVLNFERNDRISQIAEEYLSKGRQVYIHVNQIDHGKCLTGMIDGAVFVCGSTKKKERANIIERFKSGEIRCLVSTLLKEGVSIDGISCLIYAAGGKSEVATIQTIGRALRMDKEFGDAIIVDFIERGHRILENHVQERINAYRETYGDLFQY